MMRTIEIILVITILLGAFLVASYFAVLPSPRRVSSINLKKLAATTLQTLDSDSSLSETVFKPKTDPKWGQLQTALSSCLPPNIIYNLTVYDMLGLSGEVYSASHSISNAESLGANSEATSYLAASSNVKFNITPERINKTLYILNCSDSNGWWITGYTVATLAEDLYKLLSPYFQITIPVNNTAQLEQLLKGNKISSSLEENVTEAVIMNTCGEAVPIPSTYAGIYSSELWKYCYQLGKNTTTLRWTWVSIVGYPFHYVTNTEFFKDISNGWGIYGMNSTGKPGFNAFLQGLDSQTPKKDEYRPILPEEIPLTVNLSSTARDNTNKYGIYPPPSHAAMRAVNSSIGKAYNLTVTAQVFDNASMASTGVTIWIAGATFEHMSATQKVDAKLILIGLARTADIRIPVLAILCYYRPELSKSKYTASGTSKFVVLQLAYAGGT